MRYNDYAGVIGKGILRREIHLYSIGNFLRACRYIAWGNYTWAADRLNPFGRCAWGDVVLYRGNPTENLSNDGGWVF